MAYVIQDIDKDKEEQDQIVPGVADAPVGSGMPSPAGSQGAPEAANAGGTGQPGQYVNLQQYLSPNQQQAQNIAQKFVGKIGQEATEARGALGSAETEIGKLVKAGTPIYNPELLSKISADPTGFMNTPDYEQFLTQRGGQYAGPTDIFRTQYAEPAAKETADVGNYLKLLETPGGRIQALRELSSGRTTAGGLSLDELLLRNTPEAWQSVQSAQEAARPVASEWTSAQQRLADQIAAAPGLAKQTGQRTVADFTGSEGLITKFQSDIEQRVAQRRAQQDAEAQAIRDILKQTTDASALDEQAVFNARNYANELQGRANQPNTGRFFSKMFGDMAREGASIANARATDAENAMKEAIASGAIPMTAENLAALGLNADQWMNLQTLQRTAKGYGGGVNLQDYLTVTPSSAMYNAQNVATPEDIARYQALATLSGQPGGFLTQGSGVQSPGSAYAFDPSRVTGALQAQIESAKGRIQNDAATAAIIRSQQEAANAAAKAAKQQGRIAAGSALATIAVIAIVCYAAGTQVVMADGSLKNVEDLQLGDITALGGAVQIKAESFAEDIYEYNGVFVEGNHSVFCRDGQWRKVRDCPEAKQVECDGLVRVYPIVNEFHTMVIRGTTTFISADFGEVDDPTWEKNNAQRYEELCNDEEKKLWLNRCYRVLDGEPVASVQGS